MVIFKYISLLNIYIWLNLKKGGKITNNSQKLSKNNVFLKYEFYIKIILIKNI